VLGALLELAGETAQPVGPDLEEPLDEAWAEPPVFDGCSSKGQARPGAPQPMQVMHRKAQPAAAASAAAAPAANVGVQR
jgi:nitrate reductase delta subunit